MAEAKVPVFAAFKELGIDVTTVDHPEVHTVEEQEKHIGSLSGIHTKNLFLKDKKHGFFLVTAETTSDTNSKAVAKLCGLTGKVNLRYEKLLRCQSVLYFRLVFLQICFTGSFAGAVRC
jgi:Ala-tRNA(Pro) deacylase